MPVKLMLTSELLNFFFFKKLVSKSLAIRKLIQEIYGTQKSKSLAIRKWKEEIYETQKFVYSLIQKESRTLNQQKYNLQCWTSGNIEHQVKLTSFPSCTILSASRRTSFA